MAGLYAATILMLNHVVLPMVAAKDHETIIAIFDHLEVCFSEADVESLIAPLDRTEFAVWRHVDPQNSAHVQLSIVSPMRLLSADNWVLHIQLSDGLIQKAFVRDLDTGMRKPRHAPSDTLFPQYVCRSAA